jgi:hypothetical protein
MPDNPPHDDMRTLWQAQRGAGPDLSLDEVRQKAQRLETTVAKRNRREYVATVVTVLALGIWIWSVPARGETAIEGAFRVGLGLIGVGLLYSMYQVHRRGSARAISMDMALAPSVESYRGALVRQRDLYNSVWSWGLWPLFPGMAVIVATITIAAWTGRVGNRDLVVDPRLLAVLPLGIAIATFGLLASKNKQMARRIQRRIDAVDVLGRQ